jgi:hypothetical protein
MDAMNDRAQTSLFHQNIFNPSIMPKGIRLKKAMSAFIPAMIHKEVFCVVEAIMAHRADRMMFVKGPDKAVFPAVSFVTDPAIITAPGEMILKYGRSIETSVIRAPCIVNRNSAHNPKCCAENLWASSWRKKLRVNAIARLTRPVDPTYGTKDKPTPKTSNVPRVRCLSSVVLNQKTFAAGGGV